MRLLQINTVVNTGSTGRIMEGIGKVAISSCHESFVVYYKSGPAGSSSKMLKTGNKIDLYVHGIRSRLIDRHGFGSARVTKKLIDKIRKIDPDIIGLHNLHGYYLNVEILFNYLKDAQKPVVWTFHDCWPFTGHCVYFDRVGCEKWKTECHSCPQKKQYPASYGLDQSNRNYHQKRELFNGLKNLTIVTPSAWLKSLVKQSFLKEYPVEVIHNGIDLQAFSPVHVRLPEGIRDIQDKKIILGVASIWDERKGLAEFKKLSPLLSDEYRIVLVGLNEKQIRDLPDSITGVARTESVEQLAALYSSAHVYVNPTLSDNFPTTNIEALACGTPVITYKTGGSPESISEETGIVVPQRDVAGLADSIAQISKKGKSHYNQACRDRAVSLYSEEERFSDYVELYEKMLAST